jgi:hypothetical protein
MTSGAGISAAGAYSGSSGGNFTMTSGSGGDGTGSGGSGGNFTLTSGTGGNDTNGYGAAGNGGSFILAAGNGGIGFLTYGSGGNGGNAFFNPGAGGIVTNGGATPGSPGANGFIGMAVSPSGVWFGDVRVGTITAPAAGVSFSVGQSASVKSNFTAGYFVGNGGGLTNLVSAVQCGWTNVSAATSVTIAFRTAWPDTNYTVTASAEGATGFSFGVGTKTTTNCVLNFSSLTGGIEWMAAHWTQ